MPLQSERERVAHLLRRFGLGASEAEVDFYGADGVSGAIDRLLDYEDADEGFPVELSVFANPNNGVVPIFGVQSWWYLRLMATRHPLEQKLTLFWHDHFATSAAKVTQPNAMYRHIETLRENATGRFLTLLTEVSKDPAMLYWLDNNQNVKGTPNENFAREVMELFTLGVDNLYTEHDVLESARAFTGWTFGVRRGARVIPTNLPVRNSRFVNIADRHDGGMKSVFGETGAWTGDDVLEILCDLDETAEYITLKMWEWFAYAGPDEALIKRLAKSWQRSGLDVRELVRSIVKSEEFYSDQAVRSHIKNPVEFCISTVRALGLGRVVVDRMMQVEAVQARRVAGISRLISLRTKSMGMELLFPPDVDGWVSGTEWITTGSMIERIKFADVLFGRQARATMALMGDRIPAEGASPTAAVDRLLSVFDVGLGESKVQRLYDAAVQFSGGTITARNLQPTLNSITRLIFSTPEFQFS